jgi:hypothetical protein
MMEAVQGKLIPKIQRRDNKPKHFGWTFPPEAGQLPFALRCTGSRPCTHSPPLFPRAQGRQRSASHHATRLSACKGPNPFRMTRCSLVLDRIGTNRRGQASLSAATECRQRDSPPLFYDVILAFFTRVKKCNCVGGCGTMCWVGTVFQVVRKFFRTANNPIGERHEELEALEMRFELSWSR